MRALVGTLIVAAVIGHSLPACPCSGAVESHRCCRPTAVLSAPASGCCTTTTIATATVVRVTVKPLATTAPILIQATLPGLYAGPTGVTARHAAASRWRPPTVLRI
jgi:hypothetical protein